MDLLTLHPEWIHSVHSVDHPAGRQPSGRRRVGTALWARCPCGCDGGMVLPLANPLDDGPVDPPHAWGSGLATRWRRTGDTFDTLTLEPSILLWDDQGEGVVHWHGWITRGQISVHESSPPGRG